MIRFLNQCIPHPRRWKNGLLLCLALGLWPVAGFGQDGDFHTGLEVLAAEDGDTAIQHFESLLQQIDTPALRRNLAAAHLLSGDKPAALGHLEVAGRQAPWDRSLWQQQASLRETLKLTPASSALPLRLWESLSLSAASVTWMILASIFFWAGLTALCLPLTRKRPMQVIPATVLWVLTLTCLALLHTRERSLAMATFIGAEPSALRTAPASAAPEAARLVPGERVRVLSRHETFVRVESEQGDQGWIAGDGLISVSVLD